MIVKSRILTGVAVIALITVMGACSPKDKGGDAGGKIISADAAPLGLRAPDDKIFAEHFKVPERKVDNQSAETALKALGLNKSGDGALSWDSRTGKDGTYVYTKLRSVDEDGDMIAVERAVFYGVHMEEDRATFDRADLTNITITADGTVLKAEAVAVARPSVDAARDIVRSLSSVGDMAEDIEMDGDIDFGAVSLTDVTISGDEVSGTVGEIVFGSNPDTERGDVKIEAIDLKIPLDNRGETETASLTLDGFSLTGFDASETNSLGGMGASQESLANLFGGLGSFAKPYDTLKLDGLSFDSPAFKMALPGFEGKAETKKTADGDITTVSHVGEPFVMEFSEPPKGLEAMQAYSMLKNLGFDRVELTSSQTMVIDEPGDTMRIQDGRLDMKDGFRLDYTYGVSGVRELKTASETARAARQSGERVNQAAVTAALQSMKFDDLKLSLEDRSIAERGLKLAAEMRGAEPKRVLSELKLAVATAPILMQSDIEKHLASEIGAALIEFLEEPGKTLTIAIDPPEPLSLGEFGPAAGSLKPEDIGLKAQVD